MDLKRAKEIYKSFIRNNEKITPVLSMNWKIKTDGTLVRIYSEELDKTFTLISKDSFIDKYLLNRDYNIENEIIKGSYFYTSVGLISEEDYYEAEDIIEKNKKSIREIDLEKGHVYKSDKGFEYIYIGALDILLIERKGVIYEKEFFKTDSFLYDREKEKVVNKSSIKLVKEIEENIFPIEIKFLPNILVSRYLNRNYLRYSYIKILTDIKRIDLKFYGEPEDLQSFNLRNLAVFLNSKEIIIAENSLKGFRSFSLNRDYILNSFEEEKRKVKRYELEFQGNLLISKKDILPF